jgi:hypothetical protein
MTTFKKLAGSIFQPSAIRRQPHPPTATPAPASLPQHESFPLRARTSLTYPLTVRTKQSNWQTTDWRGRWKIARQDCAQATPPSRRLWLFSFGSGFGLPLACIVAVLLVPSHRTGIIAGFTAAFLGVFLLLSLRAIVLTLRKRRDPN